jgi:hypothetical protein
MLVASENLTIANLPGGVSHTHILSFGGVEASCIEGHLRDSNMIFMSPCP